MFNSEQREIFKETIRLLYTLITEKEVTEKKHRNIYESFLYNRESILTLFSDINAVIGLNIVHDSERKRLDVTVSSGRQPFGYRKKDLPEEPEWILLIVMGLAARFFPTGNFDRSITSAETREELTDIDTSFADFVEFLDKKVRAVAEKIQTAEAESLNQVNSICKVWLESAKLKEKTGYQKSLYPKIKRILRFLEDEKWVIIDEKADADDFQFRLKPGMVFVAQLKSIREESKYTEIIRLLEGK